MSKPVDRTSGICSDVQISPGAQLTSYLWSSTAIHRGGERRPKWRTKRSYTTSIGIQNN